jgi:hypothetical protein
VHHKAVYEKRSLFMRISYSLLTLIFNVKGLMANIHIGEKYRALKNLELRLKNK